MGRTFLLVGMSLFLLLAACNKQQGPMKTQNVQQATEKMAKNQSVQRAFSDGRLKVMTDDRKSKQSMLRNTMKEQQMMLNDNQLRDDFLASNVRVQWHTRQRAWQDPEHRALMMEQNLREQHTALEASSTSRDVMTLSLRTNQAILNNPELRSRMLRQYIQAFRHISADPSLRSEMAGTMVPLLKDPKIASEMQKMMKLMMAKEMKKVMAQMQKLQKQQSAAAKAQKKQLQAKPPQTKAPQSQKAPLE